MPMLCRRERLSSFSRPLDWIAILSISFVKFYTIKKRPASGEDRSSSILMRSCMYTLNALSLPDRVMVMQDDGILLHAIAKVANYPGNASEKAKIF